MALVADIIGCWGGVPNSSSLPTFLPLLSSILRFHWYLGLEEERPTLFFFLLSFLGFAPSAHFSRKSPQNSLASRSGHY